LGGCAAAAAAPPARLEHDQLLFYRDWAGVIRPVRSVSDWEHRRAGIWRSMQEVMGPLPGKEKQVPLDPRFEEETDCGDYVRRFLSYAAEPGDRVPAYLLIPKKALVEGGRVRAVLCLHQTHSLGPKVVVGLGGSPHDEYAVELARRGYVCLAPAYPLLADYHPDLKRLGYESGTMKAIWNNIRGLDLLATLPWVRPGKFACIGHSLGGHNGVFTAAFEPRIKLVIASCGLDSFRDYMDGNIKGWCSERYMPKLLAYSLDALPFDFPEVLGAIAPRRCFLSAPFYDSNFKWRSVLAVEQSAMAVYRLYGVPHHLRVEYPNSGHFFPPAIRALSYRLIDEALGAD
jgi:hypothetical protein